MWEPGTSSVRIFTLVCRQLTNQADRRERNLEAIKTVTTDKYRTKISGFHKNWTRITLPHKNRQDEQCSIEQERQRAQNLKTKRTANARRGCVACSAGPLIIVWPSRSMLINSHCQLKDTGLARRSDARSGPTVFAMRVQHIAVATSPESPTPVTMVTFPFQE